MQEGVAYVRPDQGATYPVGMARTHLTLAALATAAVAGLEVVSAARFGSGAQGDFDSTLLTGADGRHWIIRAPRSERAEAEQSADLVALRSLSPGVRSRLPFAVSSYAGQVPVDGTRAIVYEFVYGSKVRLDSLGTALAASIGKATAAIHDLPTSFVIDAGLPNLNATDCLRSCITVIDRAAATGLVPVALLSRWEQATQRSQLWQFQPAVINGALNADSFLSQDGRVTGVLGWQDLKVGDPARDLFWLLAAPGEHVTQSAFDAYTSSRSAVDRQVATRAMLHAELELAQWLLHGTEIRDTGIVDDAVGMLHNLADRVDNDLLHPLASPASAG